MGVCCATPRTEKVGQAEVHAVGTLGSRHSQGSAGMQFCFESGPAAGAGDRGVKSLCLVSKCRHKVFEKRREEGQGKRKPYT